MFGKIVIFTMVMAFIPAFVSGPVQAANVKVDNVAKTLMKYKKTGKTRLSISLNRIYDSKVINDDNILFVMNGKKAYLNILPHRCSTLGYSKAFSYTLYTDQLSHLDMITVIDPTSGFTGPTCGLGKFVEYVKKTGVEKIRKN